MDATTPKDSPEGEGEPAPKHRTWREWTADIVQDPPVLTRAEMLRELAASGCDVPPRTLQHWEAGHVLPYAVRRWHEGKPAALYPPWHAAAVAEVAFNYRLRFRSLPSLAKTARRDYRRQARAWVELRRVQGPEARLPIAWEPVELSEDVPKNAYEAVQAWLRALNHAGSFGLERAEINLVDRHGRVVARHSVPTKGDFYRR